jgi:transposase
MRGAPPIILTEEERKTLTRLAKSRTASVRLARRAQMILRAAGGESNEAIAEALGVGRVQVGRWRARYAQNGLAAIAKDRPRGGRPTKIDSAEIVRITTQTTPDQKVGRHPIVRISSLMAAWSNGAHTLPR